MHEQMLELIKTAMRARSISQADLAARLSITPAAVSNLLSGRRSDMSLSLLERYLGALGVELEWTMELVDLGSAGATMPIPGGVER